MSATAYLASVVIVEPPAPLSPARDYLASDLADFRALRDSSDLATRTEYQECRSALIQLLAQIDADELFGRQPLPGIDALSRREEARYNRHFGAVAVRLMAAPDAELERRAGSYLPRSRPFRIVT